jgi:hypothetical protein
MIVLKRNTTMVRTSRVMGVEFSTHHSRLQTALPVTDHYEKVRQSETCSTISKHEILTGMSG